MKKILLGTSALAAAALTAGAASAEAPTVTFDGAVTYDYVMFDNDNRTATGAVTGQGQRITANEQQSELHWTINGAADNGLEYTGRLDWRVLASAGASSYDEAWVKLGGSWGSVVLGSDDGAEGNMPDANSLAGAAWGTDGNNLQRHMNNLDVGTALYYFSPAGATSDANKIAYYSPDFSGFSVAASYTPDSGSSFQAAATDGSNSNVGEIALEYAGDFGGVGLTLAGSYITGTSNALNGANNEDIGSYHLGGLVSVGDFGFGAGYIDSDDSGTTKGNTTGQEGLSGYNLAVSYSMENLYLNVGHQHTENRTGTNTQDNEFDITFVGATYTIADGLSTYAQYSMSELDSGAGTGNANENDANILIVGTSVKF